MEDQDAVGFPQGAASRVSLKLFARHIWAGDAHFVYGFLWTTALSAIVAPIHPNAMPLILTTDKERDVWIASAVR
jgi:hypothetical protein